MLSRALMLWRLAARLGRRRRVRASRAVRGARESLGAAGGLLDVRGYPRRGCHRWWIVASMGTVRSMPLATASRPTARRTETARMGSGTAAYGRARQWSAPVRAVPKTGQGRRLARAAQDRQAQEAAGGPHPKPHAQTAPLRFVTLTWARAGPWPARPGPHGASPLSSLSAGRYAAICTTFSSRVYGIPQRARVSSKSVIKQSSAWHSTVSATSASE